MSDAYEQDLLSLAMESAQELGFLSFTREGVYCLLAGPCYETIAECRMLQALGADAVGKLPGLGWYGWLGTWIKQLILLKADFLQSLTLSSKSPGHREMSSVYFCLALQWLSAAHRMDLQRLCVLYGCPGQGSQHNVAFISQTHISQAQMA